MPRHIGQIEPWIGGSLALFTAGLLALNGSYGQPLAWIYVALTALLAGWSWHRPARRQSALLKRAIAFALLGFGQIAVVSAASSLLTFWLVVPMVFYAFLLKESFAWGLLVVCAVACVGAMLMPGTTVPPITTMLSRVAFLFVFAIASIRMGTVLRRTDELLESRRVDASSGMLNEYGFTDYGEELWADCRRSGLPATLVFLDVPDLPRLKSLYGGDIARQAVDKVFRAVHSLGTGRHIVARLGGPRFVVFMPGSTREQAMYFLGDKMGHPPQIEIDDDGLELIFLVNVHAAENDVQSTSFSRFYESERDMCDFYFSERPEGEPVPPAPAVSPLAGSRPPQVAVQPVPPQKPLSGTDSQWNQVDGAPSTLQLPPHR